MKLLEIQVKEPAVQAIQEDVNTIHWLKVMTDFVLIVTVDLSYVNEKIVVVVSLKMVDDYSMENVPLFFDLGT